MINITDAAAAQIQAAIQQSDESSPVLRLAGRRMPDGGVDHTMGFDELKSGDMQVTVKDIDVVISRDSKMLLQGLILDYVEIEPGDHRFIFNNPNDTVELQQEQ